MIRLPPQKVVELQPDELGLIVLADLIATSAWSEWNYLRREQRSVSRRSRNRRRSRLAARPRAHRTGPARPAAQRNSRDPCGRRALERRAA
jgi:hypothetical protein